LVKVNTKKEAFKRKIENQALYKLGMTLVILSLFTEPKLNQLTKSQFKRIVKVLDELG